METCTLDEATADAFWTMISRAFSALGVVDDEGTLIGVLSASEVRGLTDHNLDSLTLTVGEFLEIRQVCGPCLFLRLEGC